MRGGRSLIAALLLGAGCSGDAGVGPTTGSSPTDARSAASAAPQTVALRESSPGLPAPVAVREADARAAAPQRVLGGRVIEA